MYALGLLCTYVRIYVCIWRSKGSKTGLGKKTKQNKPVSSGILFWQSLFQGASKHPLWPGVSRFEERTLAGSFIRDLAIFIWSSLHLAVSSLFPHWAATPSETIVFSLKKKKSFSSLQSDPDPSWSSLPPNLSRKQKLCYS